MTTEELITVARRMADDTIVSQSRAVNALLDIFNSTNRMEIRAEIAGVLSEWRRQSLVLGADMRTFIDQLSLQWELPPILTIIIPEGTPS